ncbi:MAG: LD-carboxypeptidase [Burkholderiales bacterium]|nr:LD-carboxypeptidase [Burkholderiales bacterium]
MHIHFHKTLPSQPRIAIVAPSGAALDETNIGAGIQALENAGFLVSNFYQHEQRFQRFAASDEARLQQLHVAIADPDIDIVMGLRGSYGLSRILHRIDLDSIAASGKLLVGYSDFNALQLAMLAKTQTASLCGPMLCNDFTRADLRDFTQQQFLTAVHERRTQVSFQTDEERILDVQGLLWGGNLAMICHLLGTPYFPHIDGGILFVEDIAEHPFRVERMLLQLHNAGVLQRQKAIVLGNFSAYRLAPQDNGYDFDAMLRFMRETISTPILTGLPFGHCDDKASLMQGAMARLVVDGVRVDLSASF